MKKIKSKEKLDFWAEKEKQRLINMINHIIEEKKIKRLTNKVINTMFKGCAGEGVLIQYTKLFKKEKLLNIK
jgi:hypothetical protein